MSLLELKDESLHTQDPAHEGEDYAKGSSYILWASLAAFVVVTVGITLFLLSVRKPPVAAGEVTQVWAHAVHTLNTPMDANGVQTAGEVFDQVLVFGQVRVRNQSDQPIVLREMMTNVTLPDGPRSSYVAGPNDYSRIFIGYPELAGLRSKTLVRETVIKPNEVLDGMVVSAFHVSKEDWAKRKDLSFTFQFKFHPDLVLTPTGPITEQQ
jgi:hypothetical protein